MMRPLFYLILIVVFASCQKKSNPVAPLLDTGNKYGSGSISFVQTDSTRFSVTGQYKPSSMFGSDTGGQGAGGFVYDTLKAGKPLEARFAGYYHTMRNGLLNERLIVCQLENSTGPLTTGTYNFVRSDSAGLSVSISP